MERLRPQGAGGQGDQGQRAALLQVIEEGGTALYSSCTGPCVGPVALICALLLQLLSCLPTPHNPPLLRPHPPTPPPTGSLKPSGEEDPASTHGSCPTLAGEKWSATRCAAEGSQRGGIPCMEALS